MSSPHFISHPATSLQGDITVPGDKSISHRAIMFGAIAKGTTTVSGFLEGEDCLQTLNAFKAMGVVIDRPASQKVVIHGVGKHGLQSPAASLYCGNSGTTMRLLVGLLAAQPFDSELTGDESLSKRPMARVCRPLQKMGAKVAAMNDKPPLRVQGAQVLQGITYEMPIASAQVKSCLLLAGLYAKGETRVIEHQVTRDHTERMLAAFSYPIATSGNILTINANGECRATDIDVPGDISSAAFFIVAATLVPDSSLVIRNVGVNPTRIGILHILERMGANIDLMNPRYFGEEPVADIHVKHSVLKGIDIPSEMVPLAIDEFPIIFVAASCAKGQTSLRGAKELRSKESDRLAAMADGLEMLGIHVKTFDDGIVIQGGAFTGGVVDSQHDHRIAMAFSIAGSVASAPVSILNCLNVATSFPAFVDTANTVNLSLQETDNEC